MDNLKVSIIVPTYNIQEEIGRCVESITSQTYKNIEIILVDDGSKDDTPLILQQMAENDGRIKVICKENGGVTSARLRGVKEATGQYVGFIDGDDYIEPEMYERLVENAVRYEADISHCGYRMVFHNRVDLYYGTERLVVQNHIEGLKDLLSGEFVEPGLWNKLFHRKLLDILLNEELMDGSVKINEDLLMNFYLFREAHVSVYEDFCPYHYIVRAGSAANKKLNEYQLLDPIKVTRKLLDETKKELELYYIVQQKYVHQLIKLATHSLKDNSKLIVPHRKKARKALRSITFTVLMEQCYSVKLKIMTLWVAICPLSYQWVHALYAKITGLDKIYDLE